MSSAFDARAARAARVANSVIRQASAEKTARRRLAALKRQVEGLPDDIREAVVPLLLFQSAETEMLTRTQEKAGARVDRYVAFGVGILFAIALLFVTLSLPEPTTSQIKVIAVLLGIDAGCFAMYLTGTIQVAGRDMGVRVRATGALGVAVFVMLFYRYIL